MIWDVHLESESRIRILIFYPSQIPDSGVKKAPDPGSGSATLIVRKGISVQRHSPASLKESCCQIVDVISQLAESPPHFLKQKVS